MSNLVFLDTETTSLRPDRRAWEVAYILRRPDKPDFEASWFIDVEDLDLGNADPMSLSIGRFYERHPRILDTRSERLHDERFVASQVEAVTRGAHIIGGVPNFDTDVLAAMLRRQGLCPSWHYHLQDFETLIVGFLRGQGRPLPELPWKSDDLSRLIGVEPPSADERHTALGDAKWAMRVWDAVVGA